MDNIDFLVSFMNAHDKDTIRRLPLSRVRAICRTVPTVTLLSADAPVLISKLAELFIADVTNRGYRLARANESNTVTADDISYVFNTTPEYDFLAILRDLQVASNTVQPGESK